MHFSIVTNKRTAQLFTLMAVQAMLAPPLVRAAVSPEEAKKLGGPVLTEWGAERAGNADGSIPTWTGDVIKAPAAYDPKDPGRMSDPFGDKPLYSIKAQNMDKYADKLKAGEKAMLKMYPAYRMDIYPTRRTQIYPQYILDNSIKNATSCHTTNSGMALEGCYAGVPFPIPKTGNEAVWNKLLGYQALAFTGMQESWLVDANGGRRLQGVQRTIWNFPYWDPDRKGPAAPNSLYWRLNFFTSAPPRRYGEKYVITYSLDPFNPGLRAWTYIPGQRRVKLAPDLAYDTPGPASGGSATMDESSGGFLGAMDRYDFKLIGKKEAYMMVNNNKLQFDCPAEKALTPKFVNPDCTRWELRRVWVVEAKLKPGYRHIIGTRTLYIDEDNGGHMAGDMYDMAGKIYRVDYAPAHIDYISKPQVHIFEESLTYDLQTGIYAKQCHMAFKGGGFTMIPTPRDSVFSPEALAGEGIR